MLLLLSESCLLIILNIDNKDIIIYVKYSPGMPAAATDTIISCLVVKPNTIVSPVDRPRTTASVLVLLCAAYGHVSGNH